jgi:hypothetical protein
VVCRQNVVGNLAFERKRLFTMDRNVTKTVKFPRHKDNLNLNMAISGGQKQHKTNS